MLEAAARRYPVEIAEVDTQVRQEKYVMATSTQTSQDQLKCILTITGDSITSAVVYLFVFGSTSSEFYCLKFLLGYDFKAS